MKCCSFCGEIDGLHIYNEVDGNDLCRICYLTNRIAKLGDIEKRLKALESHKPTAGPWPVHYYKVCYGGTPPAAGCDCTKDEQAECERDRKTILPPPLSEPDQRMLDAVAVAERLTTENEALKAEIDTFRARLPHPPFDRRRLEPSDFSKKMQEMMEKERKEHPTFPPQWGTVNTDSQLVVDNADLKSEIRTLEQTLELRDKIMRKIDAEQSDEHAQLALALGIMTSVPKHAEMIRQVRGMRAETALKARTARLDQLERDVRLESLLPGLLPDIVCDHLLAHEQQAPPPAGAGTAQPAPAPNIQEAKL